MDLSLQHRNEQTIEAYINLFNNLEFGLGEGLFESLTDEKVRFVDPFNDVMGHSKVKKVLTHFIAQIEYPHFSIKHISWSDNVCFLRWDFEGKLPSGKIWAFPGVSEIHLNETAKVTLHYDHWDASQHFYQQLPIVGTLLRWIRKRVQP